MVLLNALSARIHALPAIIRSCNLEEWAVSHAAQVTTSHNTNVFLTHFALQARSWLLCQTLPMDIRQAARVAQATQQDAHSAVCTIQPIPRPSIARSALLPITFQTETLDAERT
jgi:hypothetical protein